MRDPVFPITSYYCLAAPPAAGASAISTIQESQRGLRLESPYSSSAPETSALLLRAISFAFMWTHQTVCLLYQFLRGTVEGDFSQSSDFFFFKV